MCVQNGNCLFCHLVVVLCVLMANDNGYWWTEILAWTNGRPATMQPLRLQIVLGKLLMDCVKVQIECLDGDSESAIYISFTNVAVRVLHRICEMRKWRSKLLLMTTFNEIIGFVVGKGFAFEFAMLCAMLVADFETKTQQVFGFVWFICPHFQIYPFRGGSKNEQHEFSTQFECIMRP